MGAQNRSSTSGYNAKRRDGIALIRNVILFLLVITGCFALGFFVISRLTPGDWKAKETPNDGSPITSRPPPSVTGGTPSENAIRPATPAVPSHPAPGNVPGPTIGPANEGAVQTPRSPDSPQGRDASPDNNSANTPSNPSADVTDKSSDIGGDSKPKPSRKHKSRNSAPDETQRPTSPDSDTHARSWNTDRRPKRDPNGDSNEGATNSPSDGDTALASRSHSGLYRVQVGVYSTPAGAQEERQRLRDKGFEVNVSAPFIREDGHTYYRLQYGAFHDRSHAEDAKQSLAAAGIDAYIRTPDEP